MADKKINISNRTVAYHGAVTAVAAVFAYSLAIMIYAVIRSSVTIYSIMQGVERSSILLLNGFSVAYSVVVFSLLMALLSPAGGALAAVILKKSLLLFNPRFNFIKAVVTSFVIAITLLIIVYLLMYSIFKDRMTFNYIETFVFWFLCPAVIFLGTCVIAGNKLNRILKANACS